MIDYNKLMTAFEQLYHHSNCAGLPLENDEKPFGENTVLFHDYSESEYSTGEAYAEDCKQLAEVLRELGW